MAIETKITVCATIDTEQRPILGPEHSAFRIVIRSSEKIPFARPAVADSEDVAIIVGLSNVALSVSFTTSAPKVYSNGVPNSSCRLAAQTLVHGNKENN